MNQDYREVLEGMGTPWKGGEKKRNEKRSSARMHETKQETT